MEQERDRHVDKEEEKVWGEEYERVELGEEEREG